MRATQTVIVNGQSVPIGRANYGWVVRYGKFKGVGSYRLKPDLINAIADSMAERVVAGQ